MRPKAVVPKNVSKFVTGRKRGRLAPQWIFLHGVRRDVIKAQDQMAWVRQRNGIRERGPHRNRDLSAANKKPRRLKQPPRFQTIKELHYNCR